MRVHRFRLLVLIAAIAVALVALPAVAGAATTGEKIIWDDTVLTEDHHGFIRIWGEGATLDCDGHSVVGDGTTHGINIAADDVTVKNCAVSGFMNGIVMWSYTDNGGPRHGYDGLRVEGNTVFDNSANGIRIDYATNAKVEGNKTYANGFSGILLRTARDSVVESNKTTLNDTGIELSHGSVDNRIESNVASRNTAWGINFEAGFANLFEDNKCKRNGIEDAYPFDVCR